MWLKCYTAEEIAEAVSASVQPVKDEIDALSDKSSDMKKNPKVTFSEAGERKIASGKFAGTGSTTRKPDQAERVKPGNPTGANQHKSGILSNRKSSMQQGGGTGSEYLLRRLAKKHESRRVDAGEVGKGIRCAWRQE